MLAECAPQPPNSTCTPASKKRPADPHSPPLVIKEACSQSVLPASFSVPIQWETVHLSLTFLAQSCMNSVCRCGLSDGAADLRLPGLRQVVGLRNAPHPPETLRISPAVAVCGSTLLRPARVSPVSRAANVWIHLHDFKAAHLQGKGG